MATQSKNQPNQTALGQVFRATLPMAGAGVVGAAAGAGLRGPIVRKALYSLMTKLMRDHKVSPEDMARFEKFFSKPQEMSRVEARFYKDMDATRKLPVKAKTLATMATAGLGGVAGAGLVGGAQVGGLAAGLAHGPGVKTEQPHSALAQALLPGAAGYDIGRTLRS